MSPTSRLAQFRRLTRSERTILFAALAILPLAAVGLRLAGLRRMQTVLARCLPRPKSCRAEADVTAQAKQVARMVSVAARHGLYRASCLPTALALQSMLRRRGIEVELRLGVRKTDGWIEAHAWLEHQGLPLIDSPDVREHFGAFDGVIRHRTAGLR
jgi:hypothetical protein